MKINLKKYLLYSSVFAIFTEAFFFHLIIDWKLFYLIIITNYILLIKFRKITINKYFSYLLMAVVFHSVIFNIIIGIPPNYFIAQLIGITVVSTFYYNLIPIYKTEQVISAYLKICLVVVIIGYLMLFLGLQNAYTNQLHSIFKEPAHYAVVVLPACYYFYKSKKYFLFLIVFCSLLLSKSSLGYIGCALIFIIPNLNFKRILILLTTIPFIIYIGFLTYKNNDRVKLRIDDTISSLNSFNYGTFKADTNISSYALMSNLFVTKSNVLDHPLGSGLGSHVYVHEHIYSKKITTPEYIKTLKLANINSSDANSLFLRITSEFGILGLLLIFLFLYKYYSCFTAKELIMAQGIYIYIILKLIRDGHYFSPELFLFIFIMYFSIQKKQIQKINV